MTLRKWHAVSRFVPGSAWLIFADFLLRLDLATVARLDLLPATVEAIE
jgi:hypothetical protein